MFNTSETIIIKITVSMVTSKKTKENHITFAYDPLEFT